MPNVVIRYLAIATAIVVAVVMLILGFGKLTAGLGPGGSAPAGATPSPPKPDDAGGSFVDARPFHGDAPWALSALPDCYHEVSMRRDRLALVERSAPHLTRPLAAGARLTTGTCALDVGAGLLTVHRGDDVFFVRDVRRFYVATDGAHGDTIVLMRTGVGLPEVRRYRLRVPSSLDEPGRVRVTLESKT